MFFDFGSGSKPGSPGSPWVFSDVMWEPWPVWPESELLGASLAVSAHCPLSAKKESEVAQSCPTLCDPTDCSPPGSSVHGIFQARVLEWVAVAFSALLMSVTEILKSTMNEPDRIITTSEQFYKSTTALQNVLFTPISSSHIPFVVKQNQQLLLLNDTTL